MARFLERDICTDTKEDIYTLLYEMYDEEPTQEEVDQSYEDLIEKGIVDV